MYLRGRKTQRPNDALPKEKSIESFGIKKEKEKGKKNDFSETFILFHFISFFLIALRVVTAFWRG